jgi:hypothetical protein
MENFGFYAVNITMIVICILGLIFEKEIRGILEQPEKTQTKPRLISGRRSTSPKTL